MVLMIMQARLHRSGWIAAGVLLACLLLTACASQRTAATGSGDATPTLRMAEEQYGIRVEGLHLSAAGSMLDLRYRVVNKEKAAPLLSHKLKPYLLDETRSAKLGVPASPVLGSIRQTSRNNVIHTDKTYFVMFGNPGKAVQSGDKVTLQLGQQRIAELVVR